jgi:demethylmenaquinone methyltransferase/2-methoxy-6-polyprenyl-1,4-benzoquinol methylase
VSRPDPVAVEATFSSVAQRYDLANHWLSGGIDFYWRKCLVDLAQKSQPTDILDLATGSGDVLFALRQGLGESVCLTGLDFCEPMLEQARKKREKKLLGSEDNQFLHGDCLQLPFADESFDLITISFGLRNLADREKGLSEMQRVLRPGGRLIVLEFSQPYLWFRPLYYFYLKGILPWVARCLTGDRDAYLYLGSSISEFPNRAGLCREIEQAGFSQVQAKALTFSIVSLHQGGKREMGEG